MNGPMAGGQPQGGPPPNPLQPLQQRLQASAAAVAAACCASPRRAERWYAHRRAAVEQRLLPVPCCCRCCWTGRRRTRSTAGWRWRRCCSSTPFACTSFKGQCIGMETPCSISKLQGGVAEPGSRQRNISGLAAGSAAAAPCAFPSLRRVTAAQPPVVPLPAASTS